MPFGGAILAMKKSIEGNRKLLKSRPSLKENLNDKVHKIKSKTVLRFKKVSDEELIQIKTKIQQDRRKESIRIAIVSVLVFLTIIAFFTYLLI